MFIFPFISHFFSNSVFARQNGFELKVEQDEVRVSFELINNLIVIPLKVNGYEAKFVLDTGVRTPLLFNQNLKSELKIKPGRTITFSGAGSGQLVKGKVLSGLEIEIGGLQGFGLSLVALDDKPDLPFDKKKPVDGVIGYQLFSKFIISIDYQRKELTFIKSIRAFNKDSFEVIPMKLNDTKPYIYSKVNIEGKSEVLVKLLIDTGANHALLLESESHQEINPPKNARREQLGVGLAGPIQGKRGEIEKLRIKGFIIQKVNTSFPFKGNYAEVEQIDGRNGTLGNQVLSQFHVVFDYKNEKIYLKKNSICRNLQANNLKPISELFKDP